MSTYEQKPIRAPHQSRKRLSKARRQQVMERDWNQCVHCWTVHNLTIDHIVPLSKGGTNDPDNLQVLCRRCNLLKGDRL